jgi:hypothetical protein
MRIFKPVGYQWIGPLLVLLSGFINLCNPSLSELFRIIWIILVSLSIIMVIIGIVNHCKLISKKKESKGNS